jgi:hypothetical protein
MNKTLLVSGIIGILIVIGIVSLIMNNSSKTALNSQPAAVSATQGQTVVAAANSSSTVPLMQSTGALFSQYQYASKAHEIYPALASDTKTALGAFSYAKTDLGGGAYRFTLTNNAEGFKGQSVVVGQGQTLYFIEPSRGDDSASEDSITTDDFFVVVDAQNHILK